MNGFYELYFLLTKFTFETDILTGFITFEPIIFYPGNLISLLSRKEVLNGKFQNTIPVGKLDIVRRDTAQVLGIRRWKKRAEDRRIEASCEEGQGPEWTVAP